MGFDILSAERLYFRQPFNNRFEFLIYDSFKVIEFFYYRKIKASCIINK